MRGRPLARRLVAAGVNTPLVGRVMEVGSREVARRAPGWRPGTALAFHVGRALTRRDERSVRLATLIDGSRVAVRPVGHLWWDAFCVDGVYERETTDFVRRWLRPGDVVLDVGANVGYYSVIAARMVGERGLVHAFEPLPEVVQLLRASVAANGHGERIEVVESAVTDHEGIVALHLPAGSDQTGEASIVEEEAAAPGRTLTVPAITLDAYCAARQIRDVRLLKVDVEGAELEVVRGARGLLSTVRPDAVICEIVPSRRRPAGVAMLELLGEHGYAPHRMTAGGGLERHPPGMPDWVWGNLCFLPEPSHPS